MTTGTMINLVVENDKLTVLNNQVDATYRLDVPEFLRQFLQDNSRQS